MIECIVTSSCGAVIDVNSLLSEQRMRMKKRIILALEKEIVTVGP